VTMARAEPWVPAFAGMTVKSGTVEDGKFITITGESADGATYIRKIATDPWAVVEIERRADGSERLLRATSDAWRHWRAQGLDANGHMRTWPIEAMLEG
jgi:hypothetical protein